MSKRPAFCEVPYALHPRPKRFGGGSPQVTPEAALYLTPPEAAALLRVKPDRLINFIRSGELRASNIATKLSGRPRFRIAKADLQLFLDRRAAASVSIPPSRRRKRRQRAERPANWISY